jgi:L-alanine-DL-glutamate epimerase-like enolase superfamily enzyme
MPSATDLNIQTAQNSTANFTYRQPMKFGGRVVEDVCVLRTEIAVTSQQNRKPVVGIGEMTMGNAWAWPGTLPAKITLKMLLELADRLAAKISGAGLSGDPFQLTRQVALLRDQIAVEMQAEFKIAGGIPKLAAMLASSPLEAAIHDAFGRSLKLSSFDCLTSEFLNEDLSAYLGADFIGKYPADYVLPKQRPTMPLYHLVGALDPLTGDDLKERLNDGYPETLEEWLETDGITHLKIKLDGKDIDWDVGRIVEITRICEYVASERNWKLSFDFNEQCPDEDYVINLLERIERLSPLSHDRLQYIEQPTPRDLTIRTDMTVHRLSRTRPVVIDESLTGMDSLKMARKRGYSGIALKACKGHSECLLMAAAAAEYKMFVCFQDLTCIGGAFLHSASLASRIARVAAVEGNGRQYCPIGNAAYMSKYAPLLRVRYGTIPTDLLNDIGLGFQWRHLQTPDPVANPPAKPTKPPPTKNGQALAKSAAAKPSKSKPKPVEAKAMAAKPAAAKAAEVKTVSAKPISAKPSASKSGGSKPAAGKTDSAKQSTSKSVESKPVQKVASSVSQPSKSIVKQVSTAKQSSKSGSSSGSGKSGSGKSGSGKSQGSKPQGIKSLQKKPGRK